MLIFHRWLLPLCAWYILLSYLYNYIIAHACLLNGYNLCLETSDLLCHVDTGKLIIELNSYCVRIRNRGQHTLRS